MKYQKVEKQRKLDIVYYFFMNPNETLKSIGLKFGVCEVHVSYIVSSLFKTVHPGSEIYNSYADKFKTYSFISQSAKK